MEFHCRPVPDQTRLNAHGVFCANDAKIMKILLQHTGSRLYYKSTGDWVQEENEARPFKTALEAIEFCEQQQITGVEIVLRPSSPIPELRVGPLVSAPSNARRDQP
jgi:hypothetical protein